MKKIILVISACLLLVCSYTQAGNGKHVILVTIDGFRPDFYLENQWNTPNLHTMVKEGTHAYGVNSVFPSITYPSHTTIVTGAQPSKHGVFYNGMFEPDSVTGKIYWNFHQITAPTLWQVAKDAGLTTASLNWPVSAEAPVVFNIPDIGGKNELIAQYAYPQGIMDSLNNTIFHSGEFINLGKDQNSAKIAAWAIKRYRPDFMSIHLYSVDHFEHMEGRSGSLVESAIADADESVGIIRKALEEAGISDNTLLIVTGDHGFENVTTSVQPNVWLAQAGLLTTPNGQWKARFHATGGSAFLFLKDKNDKATLAQVQNLLEQLPAGEKKYIRMVSATKKQSVGADPNTALAISGLNGASFGNDYKGEAIRKGKGGTHGFFPDSREIQTGFICVAKNMKAGYEIKQMNLRDITAIMVKYLGLKMPSCQGTVPSGLFK